MKILVTGSEGSLMQAVIPQLIVNGHQVYGIDSLVRYGKRLDIVRNYWTGYEFIKGDLVDNNVVKDVFNAVKPDVVIQAAARIYGVGGFNDYCADILGEDITLHNNILKAAVKNNVSRVVYISSSMVYENCPQSLDIPVTEDMPDLHSAPTTDYGLSKFTGERLSKAFSRQYGLDYTIWRPFNIITPYEKGEEELGHSHVFADYIRNIIFERNNQVPIIGDGSQIRCFTWIHEVAQAIADYSFSESSKNECFNLGNPEPTSMRELALMIHELGNELGIINTPVPSFFTAKAYKDDVRIRVPNVTKAKLILGWETKQRTRDSVKRCLEMV